MAIPNYSNPWMSNYATNLPTNSVGIPNGMSVAGNQNTMQISQNPSAFGNMPSQNFGSIMTVLVQGESGATAYPVASGNTVLLMDFESRKFWIKSNVNGIPQRLRTFSFSEEIQEQQQSQPGTQAVTREEFDKLSTSVNKLISELGGADVQ